MTKVAIVLGSGGIVGGAFHAGVIKALYDTWEVDARAVDLIVGTSAGSIAGSLLSAGLHPNDVFRRELGKPLSPNGQRMLTKARAHRGAVPTTKTSIGRPAAPGVLLKALLAPTKVSPGGVAAGLLARGTASLANVANLVDGLLGDEWPTRPEFRVCTVEVATARRVIFTADCGATPAQAVAASCAVPAVFAPVAIDGREFYDGGVHSADNLDIVGPDAYDLVVVSSPMSTSNIFSGSPAWRMLRSYTAAWTEVERRHLSGSDRIEVISPTPRDLDAMGDNLLDSRRRPAVAMQAYATASAQFGAGARP